LSNAYIKLGQKSRAWKVLQEAVKCDYDNWKVWDNIMVVSTDLAHFSDVISAYHRILDLKDKHVDAQVLEIMAGAIAKDTPDNQDNPSSKYYADAMKLMGRLTSQVTTESKLWSVYADLTSLPINIPPQPYKACQFRQKAAACAAQKPAWEKNTAECKEVIAVGLKNTVNAIEYAETGENKAQAIQLMSSAKMSLKGMLAKIRVRKECKCNICCDKASLSYISP
jgi:tetratricopeptide (TPR) repeat protein